jgi:signal transduction histidine kinase
MKRSWFSIFLVVGLLGLLALLAALQYRWLGQISAAEKEQMQRRLQTDTENFTKDFNRTIQSAYFSFQLFGDDWEKAFIIHFQNWRKQADYADLIKGFEFVSKEGETRRYDFEYYQFIKIDPVWSFDQIKSNFKPIDDKNYILRMPIYTQLEKIVETRMVETTVRSDSPVEVTKQTKVPQRMSFPDITGYLLIKLDEKVLREKILRDLAAKYFPDGSYKISVVSQNDNSTIFQTQPVENADTRARLFVLAPDAMRGFVNQALLSSIDDSATKGQIILNQKFESRRMKIPMSGESEEIKNRSDDFKVRIGGNEQPRIFQTNDFRSDGIWLLNVQHVAGSLESFVANARYKNLAVSFGILLLLAVSMVLIFISAQRAKRLAQRQMDFVSAVSHEFRTPLAVIYSAGENLSDGVIREENKISNYGGLIKREGKKLSDMVEQILEFAGARSGKRKYDFRPSKIEKIIEEAIAECQPAIEEKDFTLEKEFAKNLPPVSVDEKALTQAIQNLIQNALKYDDGEKWLKISARNGDRKIKITVEDKGIGIEKKELGKIFEPFFRAKSVVDAQIHGNGLGLSLVKQIVEAHRGEVRVESETGKGSRFTIELPAGN